MLDAFAVGSVDGFVEGCTSGRVNHEFTRQFCVNGMKNSGARPLRRVVRSGRCRGCGCHDFTIQLGTEERKRAATIVEPGWYCTATTDASVSSEPSELRRRSTSANSRGELL